MCPYIPSLHTKIRPNKVVFACDAVGAIADRSYNSRSISGLSYKTAFSSELLTSIFPL
jgi:hypothetical protein